MIGSAYFRPVLALFVGLGLGGCSVLQPRPDPTRFYVLRALSMAVSSGSPAEAAGDSVAVGVGPIELPEYLDRLQVVTRAGSNRVAISEYDWWAEPLQAAFARVLAQNLSSLLDTESIATYPWPVSTSLDYEVKLDIIRFEPTAAGTAELVARWAVKDGKTKQVLVAHESEVTQPAAGGNAEASVAALSDALAGLSREVAEAIRGLHALRAADRTSGRQRP